jgi:hypothetical protein
MALKIIETYEIVKERKAKPGQRLRARFVVGYFRNSRPIKVQKKFHIPGISAATLGLLLLRAGWRDVRLL